MHIIINDIYLHIINDKKKNMKNFLAFVLLYIFNFKFEAKNCTKTRMHKLELCFTFM